VSDLLSINALNDSRLKYNVIICMTCGLTGCDTEGTYVFMYMMLHCCLRMLLLITSSITGSQDRFPAHLSLHYTSSYNDCAKSTEV